MASGARSYQSRWDRGGGGDEPTGHLPPGKRTLVAQAYRSAAGTAPPVADEQQTEVVGKAAAPGAGMPLPAELRARLEKSLGVSLSGVRLHDDAASHAAAAAIGARAYATGQDVHFAQGAYDPSSQAGQRLIAHEVAHTVQQKGAAAPAVQHKLAVSQPGDAAEVEADRFADAFVAGAPAAPITGTPSAALHRDQDPKPAPVPLLHKYIKVPDPVDVEGAPAPGANEKVKWGSFWWTDDAQYVRFELSELAARQGLSRIQDVAPSFEHLLGENPDYFYNTASVDDAEKEKRRTYLKSVLSVIKTEADALNCTINEFRVVFRESCRGVVRESLKKSKETLLLERELYGIKSESSWLFWTKHSMKNTAATEMMRAALKELAVVYQDKVAKYENPFFSSSPEGMAEKRKAEGEYNVLRHQKESLFPVLAMFDLDAKHGNATQQRLRELIDHDLQELANRIGSDILDKLNNIDTVEEKLTDKKDLVWKLERAHGPTMMVPEVASHALSHPKLRQRVVSEKHKQVEDDEAFMKAALVALGIALALVPMVGPPAAAATLAVGAGAAVNIAVAAQSIRDYQLTVAMQDTDFNKAKAVLGGEPPSLFWVAMDLVVIGMELKAAAMAVKSIATAHKAASAAKAAVKAAEAAKTVELDAQLKRALENLKAEGDKFGEAQKLGQKLVEDVENGAAAANGPTTQRMPGVAPTAAAAAAEGPVAFAPAGERVVNPLCRRHGPFLLATRTEKGLLMGPGHAEGLYFDWLVEHPRREVGIWRNSATGEHVVGLGVEDAVMGPQPVKFDGAWEFVRHSHPYKSHGSRIPSLADYSLLGAEASEFRQSASSVVDFFDPVRKEWRQTTFGVEAGADEPIWVRFQDEAGGWHQPRFKNWSEYNIFGEGYKANPKAIPKDGPMPAQPMPRANRPPRPPGEPGKPVAPGATSEGTAAGVAGQIADDAPPALGAIRIRGHHGHRTVVIPGDYVLVEGGFTSPDGSAGAIVYQKRGFTGENVNTIRIMPKGNKYYPYPHGYVKRTNAGKQPLNAAGKPGSNTDTHFPLGPDDPLVDGLVEK